MPENYATKESYGSFEETYSFHDGKIETRRTSARWMSEVPENLREKYTAFYKAVNEHENEWIVLRDPAESTMEISSNKGVAGLMDEARTSLRSGDMAKVQELATRATQMEPNYAEGWALLGYANMQLGGIKEGENDLRRAIALQPKEPRFYEDLAKMLVYLHEDEDALRVWFNLEKADPEYLKARVNAGQILIQLGRFKEAATQLEAVRGDDVRQPAFQLALGQAEIRSGKETTGIAALQMAMQLDGSPRMLNSVAYAMAEAKVDLPDALKYSLTSVTAVEDASMNIRLDKVQGEDLNLMRELAPHWDTLGWVYFQSGKFAEAEKYLRAAWVLDQYPVMGEHLGDVLLKEGHTTEAREIYALALASGIPGPNSHLFDKLAELAGSPSRAGQLVDQARKNLPVAQRSFTMPPIPNVNSTGFYVLISSPDGAVSVKAMWPDESSETAEKTLAAQKFVFTFPDDHPVKLLRMGVLLCHAGSPTCDFLVTMPHQVPQNTQ